MQLVIIISLTLLCYSFGLEDETQEQRFQVYNIMNDSACVVVDDDCVAEGDGRAGPPCHHVPLHHSL